MDSPGLPAHAPQGGVRPRAQSSNACLLGRKAGSPGCHRMCRAWGWEQPGVALQTFADTPHSPGAPPALPCLPRPPALALLQALSPPGEASWTRTGQHAVGGLGGWSQERGAVGTLSSPTQMSGRQRPLPPSQTQGCPCTGPSATTSVSPAQCQGPGPPGDRHRQGQRCHGQALEEASLWPWLCCLYHGGLNSTSAQCGVRMGKPRFGGAMALPAAGPGAVDWRPTQPLAVRMPFARDQGRALSCHPDPPPTQHSALGEVGRARATPGPGVGQPALTLSATGGPPALNWSQGPCLRAPCGRGASSAPSAGHGPGRGDQPHTVLGRLWRGPRSRRDGSPLAGEDGGGRGRLFPLCRVLGSLGPSPHTIPTFQHSASSHWPLGRGQVERARVPHLGGGPFPGLQGRGWG